MVIIRTSSPEDSRAGGESLFDLSASCGLQGPGPRGRTGPPARSRRPHDRAPGERKSAGRRLAGEDPPLHRPLRAQTLSHSTTLRADVHFLRRRFRTQPPCAQDAHLFRPDQTTFFVLRRERFPFVATRLLNGRSVLGRLVAASRLAGAEYSIWLRWSQPEVLSFLVGQGAGPCPSGRSLDLR